MAKLKSKISKKNPFYISKERYLELQHFCKQYPEWKKYLADPSFYKAQNYTLPSNNTEYSNPTMVLGIRLSEYERKIELIEQTCEDTDTVLANYILAAVAFGRTYETLKLRYDIPCGRTYFYQKYREFFWRLDKARN